MSAGERQCVHIIAEAGTNHNGSVATGESLIDVAVNCGANSVKFQMLFPEGLYVPKIYESGRYEESAVFCKRRELALAADDYRQLASACRMRSIPFSTSVFDRAGVDLLDELNPPYIKIASCDLNHSALLEYAAGRGRTLIVSTGMSTLAEIEQAVKDITATGHDDIVLMHCVSVYPCPLERANLSFIDTLKSTFGLEIGFSDHTRSSLAAVIAVSKGVTFIEKHITLDRCSPGFDHAYAAEPGVFADYIKDIRSAESACAPQSEKVGALEQEVRGRARRGLFAARDVAAGAVLTEQDVLVVRPAGPLAPNDVHQILGQRVVRPIDQYEPLSADMFAECTVTPGQSEMV